MGETSASRADSKESHGHAAGSDGRSQGAGALDAAPGLARLAAGAWMRTAGWSARGALRAGRRLAEATLAGESPVQLAREARGEAIEGARRLLGVTDLESRLAGGRRDVENGAEGLRARGEELLSRSADLAKEDDAHPAFDRILTQLAPDEARILRLLVTDGPQAAVDVKTWRPLGIGSRVIEPGVSMIGRHAGCIQPARVPAYLANLYRLGLIWFTRDPVPGGVQTYQVLEAQPEVIEATKRLGGRAMIKRRSINLTPFGEQFCSLCLPTDTSELDALGPPG